MNKLTTIEDEAKKIADIFRELKRHCDIRPMNNNEKIAMLHVAARIYQAMEENTKEENSERIAGKIF